MIKALGETDDGTPSVLIGLTLEDVEPLKPGEGGYWLRVDLSDLGMNVQVTLMVGENNEALAEQVEKMKWTTTIN